MSKPFQWWISAFDQAANSKTIVQTTGQAANKVMSQKAVTDALNSLAAISFDVAAVGSLGDLPQPGVKGTIYLVGAQPPYDEYLWLDSEEGYELIGTTAVDLSGYALSSEVDEKIAGAAAGKLDKTAAPTLVESVELSDEPGEETQIIVRTLNPQTGNAEDTALDLPEASTTGKGLMSAVDKQKLLSMGNGKSAYEIAQDAGFSGGVGEWLASLVGKSAYEIAREHGEHASEADWLDRLRGLNYLGTFDSLEEAQEEYPEPDYGDFFLIRGHLYWTDGTGAIIDLGRITGKTAYEVAVDNGFTGTEEEWLTSLIGTTPNIFVGTVATLPPGNDATVDVDASSTDTNVIINFGIPRGLDGIGTDGCTGGGGASGYHQSNALNVDAGSQIILSVNNPEASYIFAPPMVLKFVPGDVGVTQSAFGFSEGDAEDWLIDGQPAEEDGQTVFDGTMKLRTEYEFEFGEPAALGDGFLFETEIDFTQFKAVYAIA